MRRGPADAPRVARATQRASGGTSAARLTHPAQVTYATRRVPPRRPPAIVEPSSTGGAPHAPVAADGEEGSVAAQR